MISQYDDDFMRRSQIAQAEREAETRTTRQVSMAQTCGEEIAEVVLRADLDDEADIRSAIAEIDRIAANARIFLLEALENKRLRKALKG